MALDHYKHLNVAMPNLALYGKLLGKIGDDNEKGNIELLLRRISMSGQDHNFEAVIAHAKAFKPEWGELVLQTKVSSYTPITSVTFSFKSDEYGSGWNRLDQHCYNIRQMCDQLSLERDVRRREQEFPDGGWVFGGHTYGCVSFLKGWFRGPVRNALIGYFKFKDGIEKGINATGTLNYE